MGVGDLKRRVIVLFPLECAASFKATIWQHSKTRQWSKGEENVFNSKPEQFTARILLAVNRTDTFRCSLLQTFLRLFHKQAKSEYSRRVRFNLDSNQGRDLLEGRLLPQGWRCLSKPVSFLFTNKLKGLEVNYSNNSSVTFSGICSTWITKQWRDNQTLLQEIESNFPTKQEDTHFMVVGRGREVYSLCRMNWFIRSWNHFAKCPFQNITWADIMSHIRTWRE
jgi:hypothetical protein